jgi:uncharacterized membrane protein YcaP (DUF421 family)
VTLLSVGVTWVNWRFPILRSVLEGEPVILLEAGKPLERNLRRQKITLAELEAQARQQDISDLAGVAYAVLETNGRISFLTRQS